MASRDLKDLSPIMQEKAKQVINICKQADVEILIYCTLRSCREQAILFRQSHNTQRVAEKIKTLRKYGYDYLAQIIRNIGPQKNTIWKTNAGPGESYHNYREAWDAVPLNNGSALWDYQGHEYEWDIYTNAVEQVGLTSGRTFDDLPHAQNGESSNPLRDLIPEEARSLLQKNGAL